MSEPRPIDGSWRAAHPLPRHPPGTDKNSRGRVLLVGGAEFVPGALRLTGEAVLRAGAGKLQLATVERVATALGVLMPEAAIIALPSDPKGEIAESANEVLDRAVGDCDTLIAGPGMSDGLHTEGLVRELLASPRADLSIVLDAAAISCARDLAPVIAGHQRRAILTPHFGEMAALTGLSEDDVAARPVAIARDVAKAFGAVVVLKGNATVIASPTGEMLGYASDCIGLATGGSGDVLAGIIGGLAARGASPFEAAAWGVWIHGEAGGRCADTIGAIGFLARDLLIHIPALMADREV